MARGRKPQIEERSAGGVLVRSRGGVVEICLILVRSPRGRLRWQLPKGHIESAEEARDAATREIAEETGCFGRVVGELDFCEYSYTRRTFDGSTRRIYKRVDFFLLLYESGSVRDHDSEVEEARFIRLAEAERLLAFESEKDAVRRAKELLDEVKAEVTKALPPKTPASVREVLTRVEEAEIPEGPTEYNLEVATPTTEVLTRVEEAEIPEGPTEL